MFSENNKELLENDPDEYFMKWKNIPSIPFFERMVKDNKSILNLLFKEQKLCEDRYSEIS